MDNDHQLIHAYLSGSLPEPEAEAFEERLFSDDDLARELKRSIEIRAASRDSGAGSATLARGKLRRALIPLALAASVAVLAFGVYLLYVPPDTTPIFRGAEKRVGLNVQIIDNRLHARWQPVPGATGYELLLFAADGQPISAVEIEASRSEITVELDQEPIADQKLAFAELTALDELGQTIIRSERREISQ